MEYESFFQAGRDYFSVRITPLIFWEMLPAQMIFFAYLYTLGLFGHQFYRILKAGRKADCYFPQSAYWLLPCVVLVMITPLYDLLLGREYPLQTSVLVGAASVSYGCLYLIEIYIRYPHLEEKY